MRNESSKKVPSALGATLLSLAAESGVSTQTGIRKRLNELGFKISQPGFAAWLYGEHAAPNRLPQAFAEAFDLSPEERVRLAVAYSFGQSRPFTEVEDLPTVDGHSKSQAATGHRNVSA